jgi:hypothetical protein
MVGAGNPSTLQPSHPAEVIPPPRKLAAAPDTTYLDGRDAALSANWFAGDREDAQVRAWLERRLPPVKDDFVRVPLPRLADARGQSVAEAARQYEQEAKVVDARLFQKVTLQLKGASVEELCRELERQTRVRLRPSRGVRDEKATVLVKDLPARDVMRAVARLFGFLWARTGEEGSYRYELTQDLRSQLAEQEMRNRDLHDALLALDARMEAYRPYLELSPQQLKQRLAQAKGAERQLLARVHGPQWAGMQVYHRLTPAERAALGQGQSLRFSSDNARPDRRMPDEWLKPLLDAWDMAVVPAEGGEPTHFAQESLLRKEGRAFKGLSALPGATTLLNLKVDHSELGALSLKSESMFFVPIGDSTPGLGSTEALATAQSPSVTRPNNAATNQALRTQAPFTRVVTLRPEPSCPKLRAEAQARKPGERAPSGEERAMELMRSGRPLSAERMERMERVSEPHVLAADVWEAVHRETGLPIVADSYARIYDAKKLTIEKATLYEALSRAADELGARWRKDGQFLLCRSTSYFWDKLKEVPNRELDHWQRDKAEMKGLPFTDLAEMALLTDEQLDSVRVGDVVTHCRELPEWELLQTPGGYYSPRPWLRWLAGLPAGSSTKALDPEGLSLRGLNPQALQEALRILDGRFAGPDATLQALAERRIQIQYAPGGSYAWTPFVGPGRDRNQVELLPVAWGTTPEAALAAARKIDPAATAEEIGITEGILCVRLFGGTEPWIIAGTRPSAFRLP